MVQYLAQEMDFCKFGIYLALRTGMRLGEICALRCGDISMEASTISVCHTVQRLSQNFRYSKGLDQTFPQMAGSTDEEATASSTSDAASIKGANMEATGSADVDWETRNSEDAEKALTTSDSKDRDLTAMVVGIPKSESSMRIIPLMPDIAKLCKQFLSTNSEAFLLTGTEKCMDPRKLQRHLKKYLEECGIEEVHFHTLRHTFATRCVSGPLRTDLSFGHHQFRAGGSAHYGWQEIRENFDG